MYIGINFLKNLLIALASLTALYLFQALLSELLDHEYSSTQTLIYNALNIPQILVQMAPPASLIATVLTLSGLNRSNELTACFSIGLGLGRLMTTILSIVLVFSCISLILQDRVLPPFFKKRTYFYYREMKKQNDFFLDVKQNKIWYRSNQFIYNLRTFDAKNQIIQGMTVYEFNKDFKLIRVVDAEQAKYRDGYWTMEKGTETFFDEGDPFPHNSNFETKDLKITESPKEFQEIEKEVDGLRLRELKLYIKKTKAAGADTKAYEVKFQSRLSLSFIPLVMAILGVPFSVRNKREGSLARDLGMCLVVTFFYWLFYSIGLSLGTNGALPPWLAAWLPSTIFTALAVALIARQKI